MALISAQFDCKLFNDFLGFDEQEDLVAQSLPNVPNEHERTGAKMHRMRPHHKSRLGCQRCKTRKIKVSVPEYASWGILDSRNLVRKCDERKPQCSHCERYSFSCEYPEAPPSASSRSSLGTSRKSSSSPTSSTRTSPPPPELSADTTVLGMADLQLMHHWTLQAYKGFGRNVHEEP